MNGISEMRETYDKGTLDESHVVSDAIKQFEIWFQEAKEADILEPNAMALSTLGLDGTPQSRIVLLKGLEEEGFIFYTNYESDKGKEIAKNPNASLLFLWKSIQRQVRVSGTIEKVSREKSERYFHSRPKGSQVGAWVSPQSRVISDKEKLHKRKKELLKQYKDEDKLPLPDFWGGYILIPTKIEFWQGRPNRLHDRLRYTREEKDWKIERIAP
ncbi:MAG: pyridoxamine 5'-phosphate oxidase [Bacteroidota bacterium]